MGRNRNKGLRAVGILTAAVLMVTLSAGCGQQETEGQSEQSQSVATTVPTTTTAAKPAPLGDYTQRTLSLTEEVDGFRYAGRVKQMADGVGIDWTYSSVTFRADCQGDVQMTMRARSSSQPSYVVAVLDDEELTVQQLKERRVKVTKKNTYTVLTDVPAGVHDICLIKLTEAQLGLLDLYDVILNGQLMELPEETGRLKIEFIGDSITSGLGNLWTSSDGSISDRQIFQDGYHTYEGFTARDLDADIQVISLSGWGVAGGWMTPSANAAISKAYEYRSYYRNHSSDKWEFSSWQPDIVVINLGTNDMGIPEPPDEDTLKAKVLELFALVRKHNPQAKIVWAFGLMGNAGGKIERIVKECMDERAAQGDTIPYTFVELPSDQNGGNGHPNVSGQERAGRVLTAALKKLL